MRRLHSSGSSDSGRLPDNVFTCPAGVTFLHRHYFPPIHVPAEKLWLLRRLSYASGQPISF
jgi:hypothetical protein